MHAVVDPWSRLAVHLYPGRCEELTCTTTLPRFVALPSSAAAAAEPCQVIVCVCVCAVYTHTHSLAERFNGSRGLGKYCIIFSNNSKQDLPATTRCTLSCIGGGHVWSWNNNRNAVLRIDDGVSSMCGFSRRDSSVIVEDGSVCDGGGQTCRGKVVISLPPALMTQKC